MDDFMIGMAVGEDRVEEVKAKNPKFHMRDYIDRIVVDIDGKQRPKFIDIKTGKAMRPPIQSPPMPAYGRQKTKDGVFEINLGASPKQ